MGCSVEYFCYYFDNIVYFGNCCCVVFIENGVLEECFGFTDDLAF